jgi:pilus assembly protein Flp/PilA
MEIPDATSACRILAIRFGAKKVLYLHQLRSARTVSAGEGQRMFATFRRLLANESGATAIEYGLICAGISLVIMLVIPDLGASLIAALTTLLNAFG